MHRVVSSGRSRGVQRDANAISLPALYSVKLVSSTRQFRAALRLRYEVFNVELQEGLQSSHSTGYDFDRFDAVVDHIIVSCAYTNRVVGTYRLQTGEMAARNLGYYSEREFDFSPYEPLRSQVLELGRACIHQEHRNTQVLMLLWKAIVKYGIERGCRYLLGCSSLTSQDAAMGAAVYGKLKNFLVRPELQTRPQPALECGLETASDEANVPKLLRAYLTVGAQICGPPALDAEFGTIDFLTLLDLAELPNGFFARVMQPQGELAYHGA